VTVQPWSTQLAFSCRIGDVVLVYLTASASRFRLFPLRTRIGILIGPTLGRNASLASCHGSISAMNRDEQLTSPSTLKSYASVWPSLFKLLPLQRITKGSIKAQTERGAHLG